MKIRKILVLFALLASIAGCSSTAKRMGAIPDRPYEVLGKSKGSAGGFMLFQLIPIMHNTKIQRAYDQAVANLKGDDLINLTMSESWFWAYIGNGYRVNIEGDVIKYKTNSDAPGTNELNQESNEIK